MKIEFRLTSSGAGQYCHPAPVKAVYIDGELIAFSKAEANIHSGSFEAFPWVDEAIGATRYEQRAAGDHYIEVTIDGSQRYPDELVIHHDESWTRYRRTSTQILIDAAFHTRGVLPTGIITDES